MKDGALRRGDLVEVKTPTEILATLDERGCVDSLPFMPEMAALCGQRLTVEARAERICDTIHYTGSRRLLNTVYLGDVRCAGEAHGGCQAECRFFWKEDWLRRIDPGVSQRPGIALEGLDALLERAKRAARVTRSVEGKSEEVWRCQATELPHATEHIRLWDPRSYVRELACGNVPLGQFARVMTRAATWEPLRKLHLLPEVPVRGSRTGAVVDQPLNLQPGEWVQVKSKAEIASTLNEKGFHRGLWFDIEMLPYCGRTFRVRQRVQRFVDDKTGKLVELKNDCITLDGAVCSGDLSVRRWFCRRQLYPYWREAWLKRVEPPHPGP
jgi:hypothetical protein